MMQLSSQIKLLFGLFILLFSAPAFASTNDFATNATFAYLIDYNTGTVLLDKGSDEKMHPASMTKLMTSYLIFDALKKGRITMETVFPVSEKAWRMQGSKMFVKVGDTVPVKELIKGIIVVSGNDACIVMAEGLSGSEENFAVEMNKMAERLGMKNTHFVNSTGWPDDAHLSSTHDLAILAKHIIDDFPEYLPLYSTLEYSYNNITQPNRNALLTKGIGADGLKTGFTEQSGYGMVATAKQDGRRVIGVVNGLKSMNERIAEAEKLLLHGFRDFKNVKLFSAGDVVENAEVWNGKAESVPLVVGRNIEFTIGNSLVQNENVELSVVYESPWPAPVAKGAHIANLVIKKDGKVQEELPLVAGEEVPERSFIGRVISGIKYYISTI